MWPLWVDARTLARTHARTETQKQADRLKQYLLLGENARKSTITTTQTMARRRQAVHYHEEDYL